MGFGEDEMVFCSVVWIVGALVILLAVWLFISYKKRGLRRRQRDYYRAYDQTHGHSHRRRSTDRR